MENVIHVNPAKSIFSWNQTANTPRRRRNKEKKSVNRPAPRFQRLARLVEDTHRSLVEEKAPLRLCVYEKDEDMLMDVVALDDKSKIDKSFSHPITSDDFDTLVRRIHTRMGLILDYQV
jgi:hypothetical protein